MTKDKMGMGMGCAPVDMLSSLKLIFWHNIQPKQAAKIKQQQRELMALHIAKYTQTYVNTATPKMSLATTRTQFTTNSHENTTH